VTPTPDLAPRPESAVTAPPRSDTAAAYAAPPSAAAPPASSHEPSPAPRPVEPSPAAAAGDNKYVVWSSAPSDVPRSGPDDR
jgi:hypothetical protein